MTTEDINNNDNEEETRLLTTRFETLMSGIDNDSI